MKRTFHIALLVSLAAHGAVIILCPGPLAVENGQAGNRQQITVLGVMRVAAAQETFDRPPVAPAETMVPSPFPHLSAEPKRREHQGDPAECDQTDLLNKETQVEPAQIRPLHPQYQEPIRRLRNEPQTAVTTRPEDVVAIKEQIREARTWLDADVRQLEEICRSAITPSPPLLASPPEHADERTVDIIGKSAIPLTQRQPEGIRDSRKHSKNDEEKNLLTQDMPDASRAPAYSKSPSQAATGSPGSAGEARRERKDVRLCYLTEVFRTLQEGKTYPPLARRRQIEGKVKLKLVIAADGRVKNVCVLDSSGHDILDDAAEEMVNRSGLFGPLPEELGIESMRIVVPVSYALE